nr:hypothetical protein KPHV_87350 [Kitasatospora purpeofusca]
MPQRTTTHDTAASSSGDFVSFRDFAADPANHRPRPTAPRTTESPATPEAPSVRNPETGQIRVMDGRCTTCIGRPGTIRNPERLRELLGVDANGRYDEGHTVCHQTLVGNPAGLPAAVCAWIAQHPQAAATSLVLRMAAVTGIEYVSAPDPAGDDASD